MKNKYNQQDANIPTYVLIFMACYVIWQMGIVWLDANNSIIETAIIKDVNFISNLSGVCGLVSIIAMISFVIKPNIAYKSCKISAFISLFTTLVLLTNNFVEPCLYVLVSACSIMSISSIALYFYTYNSINLKKQIIFEMLGVGIISLIFHNDIFKINFLFYSLVSLILLTLFIIGLYKITDVNIKIIKPLKKEKNKAFYTGIIILLFIFNVVATFGANIVSQVKYGVTIFFIGHIFGAILYFILGKSKMKKMFIPSIYIALFIFALSLVYLTGINIYTSFLLGLCNPMYFAITYYGNLAYKNTLSNKVYIIFNVLGIIQVLLMDYLLNITNNNLEVLVSIYVAISIVSFAILTIINKELNDRIDKMLKMETKDNIFICLSDSEKLIADLILKDYSNNEIAKTACLSPNTVKFHIKNILKKLNVENKKELIKLIENN